jgi:hypothetical protein
MYIVERLIGFYALWIAGTPHSWTNKSFKTTLMRYCFTPLTGDSQAVE